MIPDAALAVRMINASICAYQIYEAGVIPSPRNANLRHVQGADNRFYYQVVPEYQDAVGFANSEPDYAPEFIACGHDFINGALIGRLSDGGTVLAIRGTLPPSFENHNILEWMHDWADDADMDPVPWVVNGTDWGHVEHGFAKAALSLWPFVKSALSALMQEQKVVPLHITGHSKGGSVTYLLASLIQSEWPELSNRIFVHAFAPAVACDDRFLAQYDAHHLSDRTIRYQVAQDLVPFVPLWRGADVWAAVFQACHKHKLLWGGMTAVIYAMTRRGYDAPGRWVYFDAQHDLVPQATVQKDALPAVVEQIVDSNYAAVGAAHSATTSYLPCIQRLQSTS